jgi:hypothetical protein
MSCSLIKDKIYDNKVFWNNYGMNMYEFNIDKLTDISEHRNKCKFLEKYIHLVDVTYVPEFIACKMEFELRFWSKKAQIWFQYSW